MDHITANAETLMEQAVLTAGNYLDEAVRRIDAQFGKGYSKEHPELVGVFMKVCAQDFDTAMRAAVEQDSSMNVGAISDSLDRIARAIAERD